MATELASSIGVNSSSLITVGAVVATDTLVVGGVTFTAIASNPTSAQFLVGASSSETATHLVAAINAPNSPAVATFNADRLSGATFYVNLIKPSLGVAAVTTAGGHITINQAVLGSPYGDGPATRVTSKTLVLWDSGSIAAGAVIDSPTLDVTGAGSLYLVVDNSGGGSTRALTMDSFLDDGTTAIDTALAIRTIGITSKERGTMGSCATAVGTPALNFNLPIVLPTKIKFHLASAGAAAGRVTVWAR